ncbi:Uncharacterised protein [Aerococcus viridans]|nr:Uncharacterised protein [Aerococcus viridans]
MKFWDKLTKKNQENTEVETEQDSEQDSSASSDQTPLQVMTFRIKGLANLRI